MAQLPFSTKMGDYLITNYVYNDAIYRLEYDASGNPNFPGGDLNDIVSGTAIPDNEGSFINPAALDSYNDVYYSNAGSGRVRVITDSMVQVLHHIYLML